MLRPTTIWLAALGFAGCGMGGGAGAGDDSASGPDAGAWTDASGNQCFSSSECPVGWTCSEFGTCVPLSDLDADPGQPPEVEYDLTEPHSSRRYVWVAMTDQDRLAKIDATNLEVVSIEVGGRSSGSVPSSSWPCTRRRSNPVMRVVTRRRPRTSRK